MTNWLHEIEELHQVFETFLPGVTDSLERVAAVLADDFTIVAPDGNVSSRTETLQSLTAGHGQVPSLVITITDPELLLDAGDTLVASYVENQQLADRTTRRLSTVVFSKDSAAPKGLLWRRVHETWLI